MKSKFAIAAGFAALATMLAAAPKDESKWKNLDEKNCLNGEPYEAEELTDMIVTVGVANGKELAKFPFAQFDDAKRYNKGLRVKYIVSVRETRYNRQKFAEKIKKLKMTMPRDVVVYQDFALKEGEPTPDEPLPFYYVLDITGKVVYQGTSAVDATSASKGAAEKLPKDHPIFGQVKPVKLAQSITNYFAEGKLARPGMMWLKKAASDKDKQTASEAKRLIAAIEQKKLMNLADLEKDLENSPAMTMHRLDMLLKMWPELKTHETVAEMQKTFKEHPDWAKVHQVISRTEAYAQKPVKKASEAKEALKFYKDTAVKLERFKKNKDAVVVNEAMKYSARVSDLISQMTNWQPPPKPVKAPAAAAPAPDAASAAGETK